MIKFRGNKSISISKKDIEDMESEMGIKFPNSYVEFCQRYPVGELEFNTVNIQLENGSFIESGLDVLFNKETMVEVWGNLVIYEEFREANVLPVGSLLSAEVLCIGYEGEYQDKILLMGTDLYFDAVSNSLINILSELIYLDTPGF